VAHVASIVGFSFDGIGEILFTLWLLVMGVNVLKWKEAETRVGAAPL